MVKLPIYLDHNATTPCDSRVVEAMLPFFSDHFGNAASRSHSFGWQAEEAVDIARNQVAGLIGSHVQEVVFTSGATEAINLALKGVYETYSGRGKHIVTVATEHKAVIDTCTHLERMGAEVTCLGVKKNGTVDLAELHEAFRSDTILVAVMYANNETGVIHPVQQIGELAKQRNVLFFCDATQAVGKLDVDVQRDHIDLMSLSAHKLYGPKGVGALYVRRKNPRVKVTAQIDGGGHERGMRSGTLNIPGIVGLGKACDIARGELKSDAERLAQLRNRLEEGLSAVGDVYINGAGAERLPHVTNLSFAQVDGQALIGGLNKTMAISSGSACMSASIEPSYVLRAMGVDDELAYGSIRFSLGRNNTIEEIEFVIEEVKSVIGQIRSNKEKVES